MSKYAVIQNGVLIEIIAPFFDNSGAEIPIQARFSSDFVATLVDLTAVSPAPVVGDVTADGGKTFTAAPPPQPSTEEVISAKESLVQNILDAQAQRLGYDNIYTAVTYADEPAVQKFQTEGKALRAWRSAVWAKANDILAAVQSGAQSVPTDDALAAALPTLALPVS